MIGTLPGPLGLQFPVIAWGPDDERSWWPGQTHEASELEELLSSWPKVARLLRLSSEALVDFPGF